MKDQRAFNNYFFFNIALLKRYLVFKRRLLLADSAIHTIDNLIRQKFLFVCKQRIERK